MALLETLKSTELLIENELKCTFALANADSLVVVRFYLEH